MVGNTNYKDLVPALHLATTFRQSNNDDGGSEPNFTYSRTDNPNLHHLERELSVILGGDSITYSSGMAATFALLLHLKPKRVFMVPGYFGTTAAIKMLSELSPIEIVNLPRPSPISSNDSDDPLELGNLEPIGARDILWLETPLNPTGEILDIEKYRKLAHEMTTGGNSTSNDDNRMTIVCDATLSPPPLFTPLEFGVDYALYSATKALGGHSDLLSGVIATNHKLVYQQLRDQRTLLGSIMGNLESWLLIRSLKTLTLRLDRMSQTCHRLVTWLNSYPPELPPNIIDKVYHSSNQLNLTHDAKLPYSGHAPVFSIMFTSSHHASLAPSLTTLIQPATSIGTYHSLIEWRHQHDPELHPNLCRFSVGLEPLEDLKLDLLKMMRRLAGLNSKL